MITVTGKYLFLNNLKFWIMIFQNESQKVCANKGLGTENQAKSNFFCSLQEKTIHNRVGPAFVIMV